MEFIYGSRCIYGIFKLKMLSISGFGYQITKSHWSTTGDIITKLPESGVVCCNNTAFAVVEDHLSLQGEGDRPSPNSK